MSGESMDVDAAQARCDAASEGPWSVEAFPWRVDINGPDGGWLCRIYSDPTFETDMPEDVYREAVADAEFIAAARRDLPAALAEVRELRTARAQDGEAIEILGARVAELVRQLRAALAGGAE